MSRSYYTFVLLCFFALNVIIIESRSISEDTIKSILSDPLNDDHRKLLHAFTGYRHRFEQSSNFKALRWTLGNQKMSGLCDLCDLGVPLIRLLLELNQTSLIDEVVGIFCREYILLDENVCLGAAHEYMGVMFQVVELTHFNNKQLCSLAFECEPQRDFPIFSWNVTFPDKPKPSPRPPQPPSPDSPKLNILHLSDLHVDFSYKPGSQADCSQPLCCRAGQPVPGHIGAGFWGDYRNCDIPFWTAQALLKYAAEIEKVDFIYYTGDLPAHNVWNQSLRPGLRLISLNMNYCSRENFWVLINTTDPLGQLQWLIQWLQYAEDHEEKVHIIGHHPPRSCLASFGWNFYKIVNRYENTIAGQFYGHTHYDEFLMFYDEEDQKRPVSMAYMGPSLTTSSYLNPGYRIYSIDGEYPGSSYWVLDHRTVIMNLTASNIYNKTIFIDEYDARDAYQMEYLFPNDWHNLVQRLQNDLDGSIMSLVYQYYTKSYANGNQCDHNCRRGLLCSFIRARENDTHACDSIPPLLL
ncbi:unnamed protein product [Rotaria sp. Silwood1]|nr:unnamed protein product [Rotaria sp. Silwood1]